MKLYLRCSVRVVIAGLAASLLAGCQGSGIGNLVEGAIAPKNTTQVSNSSVSLPRNFAEILPVYRAASLQDVQRSPDENVQSISTTWVTRDTTSQVLSFYRDQLSQGNWRILSTGEQNGQGVLVAQKQDILATISTYTNGEGAKFLIQYVRSPQLATSFSNSLTNDLNNSNASPSSSNNTQPGDPNFIGPLPNSNVSNNANTDPIFKSFNYKNQSGAFADLNTVPQALRNYLKDLAQLGVLDAKQGNNFDPNRPVSRREYARWLVTANNRIYQNRPSRQIRLASSSDKSTFADVPRSDPDFSTIQGLANAGLVSGVTNGDGSAPTFRPDAQLTREELILWKVPLDLRAPLPVGSVDAVKQAWNFQDVDKISPPALRAVQADAQSGDLSNIRRSFGYTTLFQPQKIVSRAEAAATLWYFGTQADGFSAQSALELSKNVNNSQPANNSTTTSNSSNTSSQ